MPSDNRDEILFRELSRLVVNIYKEWYEAIGVDLGDTKNSVEYHNYLINNPITIRGAGGRLDFGDLNTTLTLPPDLQAEYEQIKKFNTWQEYSAKATEWCNTFTQEYGWGGGVSLAFTAVMTYECSLNTTLKNEKEYRGGGAKGTEGWNCGEGVCGFTFWSTKERIIRRFNADPRHHQALPVSWAMYQKGPHICDLDLHDALLMVVLYYSNLIPRLNGVDIATAVAEIYLEKAGRGGAALNYSTPIMKAYARGKAYSGGGANHYLRALRTTMDFFEKNRNNA